jgi:hypothetical protein|tara:strand:+ start:487 stop:684 length:198 start_codon:yes stop_codon:yes gene_type:complete
MKMSLEEAEALGIDLEGYVPRHGEALARWNAVKYREEAGAAIPDTKVVDKIAEVIENPGVRYEHI